MNIYRDERKIHFLPPTTSVHRTSKNRKEDLKFVDVGGCPLIRRTEWHEQIVRNDSFMWMKIYPSAGYPGLNPFRITTLFKDEDLVMRFSHLWGSSTIVVLDEKELRFIIICKKFVTILWNIHYIYYSKCYFMKCYFMIDTEFRPYGYVLKRS